MTRARILYLGAVLVATLGALGLWRTDPNEAAAARNAGEKAPQYKVDPFWPKPLPNNWLLGEVAGVAVDSRDHSWIVQRPGSLSADEAGAAQDPPTSICCLPAPPVIEFDAAGRLSQAWGGPGAGYEWPQNEHGLFIDYKDNVWIAGNGPNDHQVLKFSRDGTFLLQIGQAGKTGGSNHTRFLGKPTDMAVDPETNEVYVSDGYLNKRVIVFDADTGAYKRHWGGYGNRPSDANPGPYDPSAPTAKQFRSPVHAVRIAKDGLVYVGDRINNRIQVFKKDGTFVREVFIARKTLGAGSTWDVEFSHDEAQQYLFDADGTNQQIWMLNRKDLRILGTIGRRGRYAGQFHWVHNVAIDSKGNLYTSEVNAGRRAQKFDYLGESSG